MPKKILILCYYWPPSGGAGVQRWLKLSKYLFDFDIEPIIITVDENYAEYPNLDYSLESDIPDKLRVYKTKTWEPFNIYKKLSGTKNLKHGNVSSKKSFTGRVINLIRANLFVPDPRKYWKKYALRKALSIIRSEEIACVITTGPPHSVHLIGLELKRKTKVKWLADFRDPWSNFMFNEKLPRFKFIQKLDNSNEKEVLQNSDLILTATDGIARDFSSFGDKVKVLLNGYDETDIPNFKPLKQERFHLCYIGNFRDNQNISIFWEALAQLKKEKLIGPNNFALDLVGNIASSIEQSIKDYELDDLVERHGYLKHDKALQIMSSSNALLIIIPDVNSKMSINTGKIFEYLASQLPIITIGPPGGDADNILRRCLRNPAVDYHDVESLTQQLKFELERFSKNNKFNYCIDNDIHIEYSRKAISGKLAKFIEQIPNTNH